MPGASVLAGGLAVAAVLLAGPVSSILARARWTWRAPRAALVLWQAVCLSAGICLIGAGLVVATAPLGSNLPQALWTWLGHLRAGRPFAGMSAVGVVVGMLATAAALILFAVLLRSITLAYRRRSAHRQVLDLLTADRPLDERRQDVRDLLSGVRILDHPTAVAYTLPGWHSRVVLSVGLLDLLDRGELRCVIDHERAHVRARHDLLVLPFQAWTSTVGWLPGVRAAGESVAELTEMLADDWAARRSSPDLLARALAQVALAGVPVSGGPLGAATPAVAGRSVTCRVQRLRCPRPLGVVATGAVYLVAALLLAVPVLALLNGWH